MRGILFSLLILHPLSALAQPVPGVKVSEEVSSDLLRRPSAQVSFNTPAVAMAKDRRGVAIAWVMPGSEGYDRVSVARLDATGHIDGPVRIIPVAAPYPIAATAPSIAAAGQGFTIAWLELPVSGPPPSPIAAYCRLDADLNPSAPSIVPFFNNVASSPPMVRSGRTTWITVGSQIWQLQADGSLGNPLSAGLPGSDMTVATDFPQVVSGQRVITSVTCGSSLDGTDSGSQSSFFNIVSPCHLTNHFGYRLQFLSLYTLSTSTTFSYDSNAVPAIGNDGRDVLIAWFQGAESSGGAVVATRLDTSTFDFPKALQEVRVLGTFAPDSGQMRPDIAADGERFVVVWRALSPNRRSYDIEGASIDRSGNVIPFSIATTTSDEKDPSVIALGSGTFLVAYEKIDSATERRIAGRFVTFESRSHAVR